MQIFIHKYTYLYVHKYIGILMTAVRYIQITFISQIFHFFRIGLKIADN